MGSCIYLIKGFQKTERIATPSDEMVTITSNKPSQNSMFSLRRSGMESGSKSTLIERTDQFQYQEGFSTKAGKTLTPKIKDSFVY